MYRLGNPSTTQELPLRMLFQPLGDGTFHRACEADSYRGLVAAIIDDGAYENAPVDERLMARLRLADDVALLVEVAGEAKPTISDRPGPRTIDVSRDERFIRSLADLGFVSLAPGIGSGQA